MSFELTPDAQIWPRTLNSAIGGDNTHVYLIVSDIGAPSGEGLDFINGFTYDKFLSRTESRLTESQQVPGTFLFRIRHGESEGWISYNT